MLLIEEIDNYYLLILAFSDARISDPEQTLKQLRSINKQSEVQLVKADLIAGAEHLKFAARNALSSFKGPRRRSPGEIGRRRQRKRGSDCDRVRTKAGLATTFLRGCRYGNGSG